MKVIIGLLFFLLVAIVGGGVYTFDLLNKQIGTLSDELTAFRGETASQIETVSDELTAFREETASQTETLSDELTAFREGQTETLSDELTAFRGETASQIETLSDELTAFRGETASQIETVRDELTVAYVSKIYEQVKWGVVEVVVKKEDEESIGSGFVFDAKGHIVTNYHVVREATEIDVVLFDGTTYAASIVGRCKYSDIAVLKLDEKVTLEPLTLADSNAIVTGEPVVVIGSPFGLTTTVTSGIIGQEARFLIIGSVENARRYTVSNLIQYSAASYPGSSGGPLLNAGGEVIGLVTSGLFILGEEINFAISSNKVNRVASSLIDRGSFDNPTLRGTWTLAEITPEKARVENLETTDGILVTYATKSAVFEAGDVIVAIDGVTVRGAADLFNYLGEHKSVGDTITLTVIIRGKVKIEMSIELVKGGVLWSDVGFQKA